MLGGKYGTWPWRVGGGGPLRFNATIEVAPQDLPVANDRLGFQHSSARGPNHFQVASYLREIFGPAGKVSGKSRLVKLSFHFGQRCM